jgi:hypothetical protein
MQLWCSNKSWCASCFRASASVDDANEDARHAKRKLLSISFDFFFVNKTCNRHHGQTGTGANTKRFIKSWREGMYRHVNTGCSCTLMRKLDKRDMLAS